MSLLDVISTDDSLSFTSGDVQLCRYVFVPDNPQLESPRPFLHPIRTTAGDLVSLYRPHDHVWHKGISLALPNVSEANFWGGVTYVRDRGYVQLDNNGRQTHEDFESIDVTNGRAIVVERLRWDTQDSETVLTEQRRLGIEVLDDSTWRFDFETALTNVRGKPIEFGSPTTEGRDNAGYAGLFWRGPRSFNNGTLLAEGRPDNQDMMGERTRWLAYVGKHDGIDRSSTILFVDDNSEPAPTQWFVRSDPYACVCPAPFFDQVRELPDGETLRLRYRVFIASGAWSRSTIEQAV